MSNYLVEVDAWTGAGVETLRFATAGVTTRPTDNPPNAYYHPRVSDPGGIDRAIEDGASRVNSGDLILANADRALDHLVTDYAFDGRRIVIRDIRDPEGSITGAPIVFSGIVDSIGTEDAWTTVRLKIRDRLGDLEKPLLTATYAGTTITNGPTAEGSEDLKDQIKPRTFGNVQFMAPVLVNRHDLIWQGTDGRASAIVVYDGGLPLPYAGDYPTLAALQTATIAPGAYGTCLALGLFRLGGAALATITCDVIKGDTLAARSSARVVERILDLAGIPASDRIQSSFDALHARNPAEIGVLVGQGTSALALITQILFAVGAALVPTPFGKLEVVSQILPVGPSEATITLNEITGQNSITLANGTNGVPAWKVTIEHGRVWSPLSKDAIADRLEEEQPERAEYLTKATRPAIAENADVKIVHPQAREITVQSFFVHRADAEARAAELLALESVRRFSMRVTVPEEHVRFIGMGGVVTVDIPRFGLAGGKLHRVDGRDDDWRNRQAVLLVWR